MRDQYYFVVQCGCLFAIAAAIAAGIAGCSGSRRSGSPIAEPVVDLHTHLFNARDLPLIGILERFGLPRLTAEAVAGALNFWTPEDDAEGGPRLATAPTTGLAEEVADTGQASEDASVVAAQIRARLDSSGKRAVAQPSLLTGVLSNEQYDALMEFAEIDRRLRQDPSTAEVTAVARALARAGFPPGENSAAGELGARGLGDFRGYVRFVGVVTRSHLRGARLMSRDEYPDVRLFVHHMMDLERTYADAPKLKFEGQIRAMASLDRSMEGKLVHFVAFDPFRRDDALAMVKRGLQAGAIGVKFYPPSGYSAAENKIDDRPANPAAARQWDSRYSGVDPVDSNRLDALINGLFTYCEANDIPIFTHCTTGGFEAQPGYGFKSDPKYWAKALEKFPKLRVCFGHSGGEDYWFPPTGGRSNSPTFGEVVVNLCLKYPNVYCEAGYLEKISDPQEAPAFQRRLESVINKSSEDGAWKFGDKFMYGTDWFMIAKEPHPETYLRDFSNAFSTPTLQPWRRAFFGANALKFIKLETLSTNTDPRFTDAQRSYWKKLVADVKK